MSKNTDRYIKENPEEKIIYCGKLLLPEKELSQITDGSVDSLVISVSPSLENMPGVFRISETLCGETSEQDCTNEIEVSFEIIRKLYNACCPTDTDEMIFPNKKVQNKGHNFQ